MNELSHTPVTITEALMAGLPALGEQYRTVIQEPNQALAEMETKLRESGEFIHAFPHERVLTDNSLCAVDGGRAMEQLSGGDLHVIGATLGEGLGKNVYGVKPLAETQAFIMPHTSDGETRYGSAVMSALELRVLEQAATDHKIIDGAYMGNVSEIMFSLLKNSPQLTERVMNLDEGGVLAEAVASILSPLKGESLKVIAVPKSDSSYVQSRQVFGARNPLSDQVSDRKLASHMLAPGEFFVPRPLEANPILMRELDSKVASLPRVVQEFLKGKRHDLEQLGGRDDATVQNRLYSAFFKPTGWTKLDRALKVEFYYNPDEGKSVLEQASDVIQVVNSDTIDNSVMEPMSQHYADMRAKEVGVGIRLVKNYLAGQASNAEEANSITRGYRT